MRLEEEVVQMLDAPKITPAAPKVRSSGDSPQLSFRRLMNKVLLACIPVPSPT